MKLLGLHHTLDIHEKLFSGQSVSKLGFLEGVGWRYLGVVSL